MTASDTHASRRAAILGMIVTFVGGYFLGVFTSGGGADELLEEARKAPRVAVPVELSPTVGAADALVTIVEFADFECPFCSRSVQLQRRLLTDFPGNVRWAFKNFPLDMHRQAMGAARAALAAQAQGKFWEFHDRLFIDQQRISPEYFAELARTIGLDLAAFERAMQGDALEKVVRLDMEVGRRLGVQGTPSFFINGRRVEGGSPYRELEKIVRQELAYASSLLRRGVRRDQLYEELTREKGTAPGPASRPATTSRGEGRTREGLTHGVRRRSSVSRRGHAEPAHAPGERPGAGRACAERQAPCVS